MNESEELTYKIVVSKEKTQLESFTSDFLKSNVSGWKIYLNNSTEITNQFEENPEGNYLGLNASNGAINFNIGDIIEIKVVSNTSFDLNPGCVQFS